MSSIKKYKIELLSLLPFIITALFSEGFLHPDEHFVTLEFLQTKISDFSRPEIFNWDFHEKIRPWFQSFLYFIVYKVTPEISSFNLATFFRMIHGALGWYALYRLCEFYESDKNKYLKNLLWISWTWFVPFLMARTNSESLSMTFFFLGAPFFLRENNSKNSIISGVLWGASFLIRYQMGIAIAAANLWYLFKKRSFPQFILHSLFVILMIGVGVLVDYWGYQEWTFSPYNYFYTNVFESRASAFGTDPFWFYITKPIVKGGVLIPIILLIGTYSFFKNNKTSFWAPTLGSFFIVHSMIPHKEIRFLSFIFVSIVFLTFVKQQSVIEKIKSKSWLPFLLVVNFLMMSKASLTPAEGLLGLYKAVEKTEISTFHTPSNNHGKFFQFQMPFYERIQRNTKGFELDKINLLPDHATVLSTNIREYNVLKKVCDIRWMNYPEWLLRHNYFGWVDRSAITALWTCP